MLAVVFPTPASSRDYSKPETLLRGCLCKWLKAVNFLTASFPRRRAVSIAIFGQIFRTGVKWGVEVTMIEQTVFTVMESPLGGILLAGTERGLTHISFQAGTSARTPEPSWRRDAEYWATAVSQLTAYFAGELKTFDIALAPQGTPFQQTVWRFLQTIPYGRTTTYGTIAAALGNPNSSRAVGAANGRNPLPIIIPCHRVVGSSGKLTGYAGGLRFKVALLALERNGRYETGQQLSIFN